jgi:hypothetical protein
MSESAPGLAGDLDQRAATPFVFLGPSLPVDEARRILDAVYLPPASMGDVFRLMARRPRVIAIIDGLFEQTPAVWHKEILFAISKGVRVLGASSMGALRAAELEAFGMEGVGEVFQAFHRGELEDDDEVAVAHASAAEGYRSLSDAMVNLRAGLRAARDGGRISGPSHDKLVALAKDLYYPDRSWPRLFAAAAGQGIPAGELEALRAEIARSRPDVKRGDAIRLLERLAAEQLATTTGEGEAPRASFDFEPTYFWDQMILHETAIAAPAGADEANAGAQSEAISAIALQHHIRVDPARARDALATALLLFLADEQAMRRRVDSTSTAGESLCPPSPAPPGSEGLSSQGRADLERGERAIKDLLVALADQINQRLPAALARLGRLEPASIEVRRKQAILRSLGLRAAAPADAGVTHQDLLAWYQRRFGPINGGPEEHARALGFGSVESFTGEVVLEYLAESALDK